MMIITDVITGINDASKLSALLPKQESKPSFLKYFCVNPQLWFLVTIIGLLCSFCALAIDFFCLGLIKARMQFTQDMPWALGYVVWLCYCFGFAYIAASCGNYISKDAEGSGIPEMKAIIGGAEIPKYLSYKTLASKTVGLIAATAAGLSIGREGPFLHISCIFADKISKLPFFNNLVNPEMKKQILSIAVAVGVSVTFGCPIGGLLFSIEVTATFYNVGNLWKALYAATLCCMTFDLLDTENVGKLISSRHYADATVGPQLIPFFCEGLLFGCIGSLFVYITGRIIYFKKWNPSFFLCNRYIQTFCACFICATLLFSFEVFDLGDRGVISAMFKPESIKQSLGDDALFSMVVYICGKYFMTFMSITCPIPCGVFTPIFAFGAVLGRLFGEYSHSLMIETHPGVYALVGAACLTSSVTHTISVIVIVFELSGQISYLPFMLVGVLTSYAVATLMSSNIYDLLITLKKIPYLALIKNNEIYSRCAKDVMIDVPSLKSVSSLQTIWHTVTLCAKELKTIPVIDASGFLVGEKSVRKLIALIHSEYAKIRLQLVNMEFYDKYFVLLNEIIADERDVIDMDNSFKILQGFIKDDVLHDSQLRAMWKKKAVLEFEDDCEVTPFTISEATGISKVHYLFVALNLRQIYVTHRGQLSGVITREAFVQLGN
jgi:H+/Cl- antiporter ClcA